MNCLFPYSSKLARFHNLLLCCFVFSDFSWLTLPLATPSLTPIKVQRYQERRAFLLPREDLRWVGNRCSGALALIMPHFQCYTPYRPLVGPHCSGIYAFLRAKKHLCWGANDQGLLTGYVLIYLHCIEKKTILMNIFIEENLLIPWYLVDSCVLPVTWCLTSAWSTLLSVLLKKNSVLP